MKIRHSVHVAFCALLLFFAGCTSAPPSSSVASAPPPIDPAETPPPPADAFNLAEVDQPPRTIGIPAPPLYPATLRRDRISGHAVVRFVVTPEGRTRDIVVLKATHPEFGAAAAKAVSKWKYKPAMKDGRAVTCLLSAPFLFNQDDFSP
jgi:TonB family C-terminal domain